jgi:hypothetical protein
VDKPPDWYAVAIDEFVTQAAAVAPVDSRRPLGDPRPLLALPLVGTGDGGARNRRGEVLLAIMRTLKRTLASVDADVVLVLSHEEGFSAAQQARRREFGEEAWSELSSQHVDQARRLAERAREKDLVLFVGAGASMGAGLPSWSELLKRLATKDDLLDDDEVHQLESLDARDAGAVLEHRFGGRKELADAIIGLAHTDRVALVHQLLASLPVTEAVTTNYDVCLETAFRDAERPMRVLPREGAGGADRWLVKLHGSVDDPSRIVLSRQDYLRFEGEGVALAGIVQALLLTRHMLFIGYSLSDDNFHRLVHQVRAVIGARPDRPHCDPFATALTPKPPGLLDDVWGGEVDYVSTAGAAGDDPRRVAIFLDLVAGDAAPPAGHLLDESYLPMFSPDEQRLRTEIREVWSLIEDPHADIPDPVRKSVGSALGAIGRPERPRAPRFRAGE